MSEQAPFCIRCMEDFPVAQEPTVWRMGEMRPVSKLSKTLQHKVAPDPEIMDGTPYLCGNCYFDLTDED